MTDKENCRKEIEQLAVAQAQLTDPQKLILYGFALGLKAENPFLGQMIPPAPETKAAV